MEDPQYIQNTVKTYSNIFKMLFNADIPGFSTGVENSFAPLIGEGGALQNLMVVVVGGLSQYMVVACGGGGGGGLKMG